MKQILNGLLFMLCCTSVYSQQVISTAGANSQTASGGISYTIGECVTETFTTSGATLTQGIQQTIITVTGINTIINLGYSITAFPNPATDFVILRVSDNKFEGLHYVLYDLNGKAIAIKQIESAETLIPFSEYNYASYILKVINGHQGVMTFKIIKSN